MKRHALFLGFSLLAVGQAYAAEPTPVAFEKHQLTDKFYSEGAYVGDFNKDGKLDIVSGAFWYEAPDFSKAHAIYPAKPADGATDYSNAFFSFADDINHDGYDDIIIVGYPGADTSWFENPKGGDGMWVKHEMLNPVDNESPAYINFIGKDRQLVCIHDQQYGYAIPDPTDATKPWTFHPISTKDKHYYKYTHGLGVGDINGDGRKDLIEKDGWWEQPESLAGDPVWKQHMFKFAEKGAQMFAYDVNGDGKSDVITSIDAHGYGLAWYEQVSKDGEITFVKHLILGEKPDDAIGGVVFSQLHGVDFADVNGDGLMDIVTGKRHWAHGNEGDPDPNGPSVLYWFELKRGADHSVEFIPHLIDNASGVGTQALATDVNGDRKIDVVIGNKNGTFVFIQK